MSILFSKHHHVILKDKMTKKPIVISLGAKIKIEEKEIEALTENIIKEYSVEFKRKVKDNETISV